MVLQGAFICSFGPYISVLAVREFGLGDRGYAVVLMVSTLVSVAAAIAAGIRADQTANRRSIALWSCVLMVLGCGLMTALPRPLTFILAHALILPLNTLFGQLFAQSRLAAQKYPAATRDGILATIRALFALPFVVVLPLWSVAFNHGAQVLAVYPVALVMAALMLAITARSWPTAAALGHDKPSGLSLRQALANWRHPRWACGSWRWARSRRAARPIGRSWALPSPTPTAPGPAPPPFMPGWSRGWRCRS